MKQLEAHRGVSRRYPENTMSAFRAAVREGYRMIELDPKVTADNEIVILHDMTVNRTGRRADGTALSEPTPHRVADAGRGAVPRIRLVAVPRLCRGAARDAEGRAGVLP